MSEQGSVQSWLGSIDSKPYIDSQSHGGDPINARKRKRAPDQYQNGDQDPPRRSIRRRKALTETSGNVMPRSNKQEDIFAHSNSHQDLPPSSSKHQLLATTRAAPSTPKNLVAQQRQQRRAKTQEQGGLDGVKEEGTHAHVRDDDAALEEETPRPLQHLVLGSGYAVSLPHPEANDGASQSSHSRASTNDAASSTRSRSPVKKPVDLLLAEVPTNFCDLDGGVAKQQGGVLDRYGRLAEINRGGRVIPGHLRAAIECLLQNDDWPCDYHYTAANMTSPAERAYQASWPHQLQSISEQAKEYARESHSEAAWNGDVHGNIIQLVVKEPKYRDSVSSMNITTARLEPKSLSPAHITKGEMQSKMVDYAICLRPPPHIRERIVTTISKFPKDAQSINQTLYDPLRHRPIAFNIETKKPFTGGLDADVQLSVWAGAGLLKLGHVMDKQDKHRVEIPTLPVLTFHGHDLYMSAIKAEAYGNNMYGQLPVGSTRTLLGTFQIVAALEVLVDWANTDYLIKWLATSWQVKQDSQLRTRFEDAIAKQRRFRAIKYGVKAERDPKQTQE